MEKKIQIVEEKEGKNIDSGKNIGKKEILKKINIVENKIEIVKKEQWKKDSEKKVDILKNI